MALTSSMYLLWFYMQKPWLDTALKHFRPYWTKYAPAGDDIVQQCNVDMRSWGYQPHNNWWMANKLKTRRWTRVCACVCVCVWVKEWPPLLGKFLHLSFCTLEWASSSWKSKTVKLVSPSFFYSLRSDFCEVFIPSACMWIQTVKDCKSIMMTMVDAKWGRRGVLGNQITHGGNALQKELFYTFSRST